MTDVTKYADVIDSRDVLARIEALEAERDALAEDVEDAAGDAALDAARTRLADWRESEEAEELKALKALADEAHGCADWEHGETLVRDSYFERYAEELAEDCGMITQGATWPNNCIDWERAARELKQDYTSVDFDGITYWLRS